MPESTSDIPLYLSIARRLESQISAGALKVGDRLPSERRIAEELGASRMTARHALKLLERQGMVETRTGLGAFVAERRIEKQLWTLTGFTEEMQRSGRKGSSIVLDAGEGMADQEAAAALCLPGNAAVHRLVRVRLADSAPVGLEWTEIPVAMAPGLLAKTDFTTDSLYRVLREEYGLVPAEAEESVLADTPDTATAAALGIATAQPVLRFTRLTFDRSGRPFEYVRSAYRGDCFTMRVRLGLANGK